MRSASFTEPSVLSGMGVHGGQKASVRLSRHAGPIVVRTAGGTALLRDLAVEDTTRSTTVRSVVNPAVVVRTAEHLFAALAGHSIHEGVAIDLEGDEVPLLDGGARCFSDALVRLALAPGRAALEVARSGVVEVFGSRFTFTPGDRPRVAVTLDFGDAPLDPEASWDGDASDFAARIAPARTFAMEHEIEALGAASLARFADADSVVIVGAKLFGAGEVLRDEPARHKLLDLLGDAYLHGGPPIGSVHALRPGHRSNHAALRSAIEQGILRRRS